MAGLLSAPAAVHRPQSRGVVRLAAVLGLLVCGGLLTPDALSPFANMLRRFTPDLRVFPGASRRLNRPSGRFERRAAATRRARCASTE